MHTSQSPMFDDLEKILFDEAAIHARLDELAGQLADDYRDKPFTAVAILHGSIIIAADLLRRIELPLKIDCIRVSSYHGGIESSGKVDFHHQGMPDLDGEHVLLLDDILDTGRTLHAIRERILAECNPASVRICVLLRKRKERAREVDADYTAFDIDDEFVVGYGLDYEGKYRNLPCVGVLKPEVVQ